MFFFVISTNSPRVLEAVSKYFYISNPMHNVVQIEVINGVLLYHICVKCDEKLDKELEIVIKSYLETRNIPLFDPIEEEKTNADD